ncbi:CoA transferase [Fulvivirga ulvae]|uniref:CaiB/BaiF CoA transferase family protein n=1 Tax=Fulvivirga ulvae TaxID=2904245 RepID=UPI001F2E57EF|nr:CaiB/BaiF CoA-transferase family protein [Fulvivirga ulvae]UII32666.1 CoA transferase [Fulvivirga ulvae]
MESRKLFCGVRVIELASVLAGPGVGQFFAELGADVIKVENPASRGDVTRTWKLKDEADGDVSAYFASINWGKKSIGLDISEKVGLEILYKLISKADIVIASYKPGDAEKLGVDYQSLRKIKKDLLYGKITGYGSDNPKVGYDAIIQAEAGFMSMNGDPDGKPVKMPVALMDVLAGHHLKEALLLAYIHRLKTGEGNEVSVSLIEAAVASLVNQGTNWLIAGKVPSRQGSSHPNIAPYGDIFTSKDQREIILAVGTDRQFSSLCNCLGLSNLCSDELYKNNAVRVRNRQDLFALLQAAISTYESKELIHELNKLKVPVGIVQSVNEALEMPEVKSLMLEGHAVRGIATFAGHFHNEKEKNPHLSPPPHFGAQTREILSAELLMSDDEIQNLQNLSIIA